MTFWNWLTRKSADRGWPGYIINGRIRTSTAALILAFFVISWVHNTYQPQPPAPVQEMQVVPPGFVPDPDYTWVPRTQIEQAPRTVYRTVTPTRTTESTPTETTSPAETPSPGETTPITPTSPGEVPTGTESPTPSPGQTTGPSTVPNRSGTPTPAPAVPGVPGLAPTPTPAPLFP